MTEERECGNTFWSGDSHWILTRVIGNPDEYVYQISWNCTMHSLQANFNLENYYHPSMYMCVHAHEYIIHML